MRMILPKDAYSIRYRDARLSDERIKPVQIGSIGGSRHLSEEAAQTLERTVTGNIVEEPAPRSIRGKRKFRSHVDHRQWKDLFGITKSIRDE